MRRRSFLAGTAAATAGLAGCGALSKSATTTDTGSAPPRLSVEGRWLTDPNGERSTDGIEDEAWQTRRVFAVGAPGERP